MRGKNAVVRAKSKFTPQTLQMSVTMMATTDLSVYCGSTPPLPSTTAPAALRSLPRVYLAEINPPLSNLKVRPPKNNVDNPG